ACAQGNPTDAPTGSTPFLTGNATACNNYTATVGIGSSTSTHASTVCGTATYDVWYRFTAFTTSPVIRLTVTGSQFFSPRLQLFTAGLTPVSCGSTGGSPVTLRAGGLTIGSTYYIRIFSTSGAMPSSTNGRFSICISNPVSPQVDFSKSFINITKGLTGGTIETGDTLEVRGLVHVKAGTVDSLAFTDQIPAGTEYVAHSIRIRTNEGQQYKQFTDAPGDDAGWVTGSTPGNTVRIHFGHTAGQVTGTATARGQVANTNRPVMFGTCIMLATYRVRVTAAFGSVLNLGGGSFVYRTAYQQPSAPDLTNVFAASSQVIYPNYGICNNPVGANFIGTESNGTFGSAVARSRSTGLSATVTTNYTRAPFTGTSGPGDYFYDIANNTSTRFSTTNAWPYPDNSAGGSHRLFNVWDIIGDHTGAANPLLGNAPADSVNPGGYMLVVNSAYKTDSVFQQSISGLCTNTYYDISAWFRNVCSLCSADSTGIGASSRTAGYVPTDAAANDSSGVRPHLTFRIDGVDYYTTGDIRYTGQWIKKGFTFFTGNKTGITLTIVNNAPGGGGNDWVIDDISVASCSPNMTFTPSSNPFVCDANTVNVSGTVRAFFSNYSFYRWDKSTNNGATWTSTGISGSGTPAQPGGPGTEYQYTATYPEFIAYASDSGSLYRLVVGTSEANLETECALSGNTQLTLNVRDCGPALALRLLSFNGTRDQDLVHLQWTVSDEEDGLLYTIEQSSNGRVFTAAALMPARSGSGGLQQYSWRQHQDGPLVYYRLRIRKKDGTEILSRLVRLERNGPSLQVAVMNPFQNALQVNLALAEAALVQLQLSDAGGRVLVQRRFHASAGALSLTLAETAGLPPGIYHLVLEAGGQTVRRKIVKTPTP
ncbi:MAG TPA: T9SS type A sorting domain-containing protein, partial [Chitinophagaceae bacterium]|nr:T9SS type A sorting domain-containing protein [Chitinophagaceae bacterium]